MLRLGDPALRRVKVGDSMRRWWPIGASRAVIKELFKDIVVLRNELNAFTDDTLHYTPEGYTECDKRLNEAIDLFMEETQSDDDSIRMYLSQDTFTWDQYVEISAVSIAVALHASDAVARRRAKKRVKKTYLKRIENVLSDHAALTNRLHGPSSWFHSPMDYTEMIMRMKREWDGGKKFNEQYITTALRKGILAKRIVQVKVNNNKNKYKGHQYKLAFFAAPGHFGATPSLSLSAPATSAPASAYASPLMPQLPVAVDTAHFLAIADKARAAPTAITGRLKHLAVDVWDQWTVVRQLGSAGKDGEVYLVHSVECMEGGRPIAWGAMKVFKHGKRVAPIQKEMEMQRKAASVGVAPQIISTWDIDSSHKCFVMEPLNRTLRDVLLDQGKTITIAQRDRIVWLYQALSKVGLLHNDENVALNLMTDADGRFFLIDFGFTIPIEAKDLAKSGPLPNFSLLARVDALLPKKNHVFAPILRAYEVENDVHIDVRYWAAQTNKARLAAAVEKLRARSDAESSTIDEMPTLSLS
tara:strand:+ start:101 stop:1681 length:1581 start_codon:yes stop_codon:yes gene_type:complete